MSDTYTGECRICGDETDLISGKCEDCALKSEDYQLGVIKGRLKEMERAREMLSGLGK